MAQSGRLYLVVLKMYKVNFYTEYTDVLLQDLLYDGDEHAFSEIYNRYWEKLLAIAYHHLEDKEAAQEIVQEVFMSLWKRRTEVKVQTIENYLATATKYALYAFKLKEKHRKNLLAQNYSPSISNEDVEEKVAARFLKDYINGMVKKLPEKCRLIFRYSRETDLSNIEIAQELNISVKTVEAHISKALKILRMSLRDQQYLAIALALLEQLIVFFQKK